MNRYLKLVHMEVHRFRWMLAILMGITAVCQISALIWTLTKELSLPERAAAARHRKQLSSSRSGTAYFRVGDG